MAIDFLLLFYLLPCKLSAKERTKIQLLRELNFMNFIRKVVLSVLLTFKLSLEENLDSNF